jgi:histidine triad (HIT) family protein
MSEIQQQETQEELMERVKKMSPEELLEFQKSRCIFCQIISGKIQSKKIYEDDKVTGILDINPANPGHILLMPKEHYSIMPQVPKEVLEHLFIVAKKLCQISLQTLGAKGTNIIVQNGIAAGQKAQHFMIHIIPRMEQDGLQFILEKKTINDNDYSTIKDRLKGKINEIMGIKEDQNDNKETLQNNSFVNNNDNNNNQINIVNNNQNNENDDDEYQKNEEEEEKEDKQINDDNQKENNFIENNKFITSSTAKRYHTSKCPFAQNIQPERRIHLTAQEAEESGRKPCTCITGNKIPIKFENNEEESIELENSNTEIDNINEDIQNLKDNLSNNSNDNEDNKMKNDQNINKNQDNNDDKSADLDEISRILGGF